MRACRRHVGIFSEDPEFLGEGVASVLGGFIPDGRKRVKCLTLKTGARGGPYLTLGKMSSLPAPANFLRASGVAQIYNKSKLDRPGVLYRHEGVDKPAKSR